MDNLLDNNLKEEYQEYLKLKKENKDVSEYDIDKINVIEEYLENQKKFNALTEDIKLIQKISLKTSKDKVETLSFDGRKKEIDREYLELYQKLSEEKKQIKIKQDKLREAKLKRITTLKHNPVKEELNKDNKNETINPPSDNIKRSFEDATISFYQPKKETVYFTPLPPIELPKEEVKDPVQRVKDFMKKEGIEFTVRDSLRFSLDSINLKQAFTTRIKKVDKEKIKKLFEPFNIDMHASVAYYTLYEKLQKLGITIDNRAIKFKDDVVKGVKLAGEKVLSIPKKTKKYFQNRLNDINKFVQDKRQIANLSKDKGLKTAMEEVYKEKKEDHLDYRIVNRVVTFNDNTIQRINTTKGKIVNTTKDVVEAVKKPFDYLRDNYQNDIKREELQKRVEEIKEQIAKNKETSKRRVKSNGFIAVAFPFLISFLFIEYLVFLLVRMLMGK